VFNIQWLNDEVLINNVKV